MKENIISVDVNEVGILADEGGKLVFSPKAESSILRLLELQVLIEDALTFVKRAIKEGGESIDSGFRGVQGEKISCINRVYGSKYGYDADRLEEALPYLTEKFSYTVDTDKVDAFIKENNAFPLGIHENDREAQLSLSLKKDKVR